jgi:hypothetical protein
LDKEQETFVFSMTAGEGLVLDDFNVEFFEYNKELCCEGRPVKVVNNFDELINWLDDMEE